MKVVSSIAIVVILLCHGFTSHSAEKYPEVQGDPNRFSLYSYYTNYRDIIGSSETKPIFLTDDYTLSLDIRFFRIFSLVTQTGISIDSKSRSLGIGLKVDLPGVFFLGGELIDLIHLRRRDGIQTYFTWANIVTLETSSGQYSIGNTYNLGADIFIAPPLFLNLSTGFYSRKGNQFLSLNIGLGLEF